MFYFATKISSCGSVQPVRLPIAQDAIGHAQFYLYSISELSSSKNFGAG
jgi:hypothetical protein